MTSAGVVLYGTRGTDDGAVLACVQTGPSSSQPRGMLDNAGCRGHVMNGSIG